MSLVCPKCDQDSLRISAAIELPYPCAERTLQTVVCSECGFQGTAVYEERRWGRLDSESVRHVCFPTDRQELERLEAMIGRCPAKSKSNCQCEAHRTLGACDEPDEWQIPVHCDMSHQYAIEYRREK